ncbi:MAG: GntR family transcriptional regulator, partial [Curtobacterium sp.]
MPIPTPDEELGPRVLLRDVAFNKLLTAIQDGTLLPGERLNDVDLTKWIGVSRPPIRETLSR